MKSVAVAFICFLFIQRPAASRAQGTTPPVLMLSQMVIDGYSYFVDASLPRILITKSDITNCYSGERDFYGNCIAHDANPGRSNVVIMAVPGSRWIDGDSERFTSPNVTVAQNEGRDYRIWLDVHGHLHTLAVLKQQLDYNFALMHWWHRTCADKPCSIELPDGGLQIVSPVKATGILDRETLWIPFRILQFKLRSEQLDLISRCEIETGRTCKSNDPMPTESLDGWQALINEAAMRIKAYAEGLNAVTITPPTSAPRPPYNKIYPHDLDGLVGIEAHILAAHGLTDNNSLRRYFSNHENAAIESDGTAPENAVVESVDPAAFAAVHPALDSQQASAELALSQADRFARDRFGPHDE